MELRIADVKEKEIDFLIAEEFVSSPSFSRLFLKKLNHYRSNDFIVKKVYRSHTDSYGESDLVVYLKNDAGKRLVLLIENKVAAQFQSNQLKRYKKRGEAYLNQDECDDYKIILLAPEEYSDNFDSFEVDACIYYKEIKMWFADNTKNKKRSEFKIGLLDRALQKAKHGYQLIESEKTSIFWKKYWELVDNIAPILNMPKPGQKPASSSFIYFYPPNMIPRFSLIHKFTFGNIDLQIADAASKAGIIKQLFNKISTDQLFIQKAGKSVALRKKVPVLDLNKSLEDQLDKARYCILEAHKSYEWLLENKDHFNKLFANWA